MAKNMCLQGSEFSYFKKEHEWQFSLNFVPGYLNYKQGCTRFSTASDKVYQLLAHGRWFSPGTPAFSTTKLVAMT
jgi:hypothetical protein